MKKCISLILFLLLLFSCSSEKNADKSVKTGAATPAQTVKADSSAQYSLELVPEDCDCNSTLAIIPHGFSYSDLKDIEWLVNGSPVAKGPTFKAAGTARGSSVQAKAIVKGREILSNIIQIKNTPPELTKVKLMPEIFKAGDEVYVDAAAKDVDGDEATVLYEWTKNGEPAGTGKAIEGQVKRGDKITVKVTPFDGEARGLPITLKSEIGNMPPSITEHNKFNFDGKVWTYQVKATDPDGDTLTYTLNSAPQGMKIDQNSGLITWPVPNEFRGQTAFTATVKDGHGGEASYTAKVTINEPIK